MDYYYGSGTEDYDPMQPTEDETGKKPLLFIVW